MGDFVADDQSGLGTLTEADLGRGFRLNSTHGSPISGPLLSAPRESFLRHDVIKETSATSVITSANEALNVLSFGAKASGRFLIVSGSGSMKYFKSSKSNSKTVNTVYKKQVLTHIVELPRDAKPLDAVLKLPAAEALSEYGTHFISAIYFGGSIEADFGIKCASRAERKRTEVELRASIGIGPFKATYKKRISSGSASESSSKSMTANVRTTGFSGSVGPIAGSNSKVDPDDDIAAAFEAIEVFQPDTPAPIGFRLERITPQHLPKLAMTDLEMTEFERQTDKATARIVEIREVMDRARDAKLEITTTDLARDPAFRANFQDRFQGTADTLLATAEVELLRPFIAFLDQGPFEVLKRRNWPVGTARKLRMARRVVEGLEGFGVILNSDYLGYTLPVSEEVEDDGAVVPVGGEDSDEDDVDAGVDLRFQPQYLGAGSWEGGRYDGAYLDGLPHGEGKWVKQISKTVSEAYEGDWDLGVRQGSGVWQRETEDVPGSIVKERYSGEWRDGVRDGHGVYTTSEGERYEGGWRAGLRNGHGALSTPKLAFVGDFVNGFPATAPITIKGFDLEAKAKEEREVAQAYLSFIEATRQTLTAAPLSDDDFFRASYQPAFLRTLELDRGRVRRAVQLLDEFRSVLPDLEAGKAEAQQLEADRLRAEQLKDEEREAAKLEEERRRAALSEAERQAEDQAAEEKAAAETDAAADQRKEELEAGETAGPEGGDAEPAEEVKEESADWDLRIMQAWPLQVPGLLATVRRDLDGMKGDAALPVKHSAAADEGGYPDFRGFHLDGVPAFKGTASLEGGRYEGYWLDGQPHGAGVWVGGPDNQDRFEGLWHKGVRNGPGLFFPGGASEGQPRVYDGGVEGREPVHAQKFTGVAPEKYGRVFPLRHSDQRGEQLAQEAWEEPRCVGFTADGVLVYAAQLLGAGTAAAGPKLPLMVKPQESVRAARVATLQASTGRFIGEKNERLHGRSVSAASREVFELVGVGRMVALRASSGARVGVDRSFEPVCTARGAAPGKTELWAVEVVEGQRVGVMGHTSRQWLSLQHDGGVRGARMLRERETLTMTKVDVVLPM